MNESDTTTNLLNHLRDALRPPRTTTSAVITKLADRSTGGLPDCVVTFHGRTYWLEIKYQRPSDRLGDLIGTLQLTFDHLLNVASDNRCWIVVFTDDGGGHRWLTIWRPAMLFAHLYPQLVGPDEQQLGCIPHHFSTIESDLAKFSLMSYGAIRFDGWPFEVIEHLIRNDQ